VAEQSSKLADMCEPVFTLVCRVSYAHRSGLPMDEHAVRAQVERTLADVRRQIESEPGGTSRFEEVRLPLLYFIDFHMVSIFPNWPWLSAAESAIAPGSHFYDLLEEAMKDSSPEATERLRVFFRCLALGFTGECEGDAPRLGYLMRDLYARIRGRDEPADPFADRIIPQANEHTIEREVEPPVGDLTKRWLLGLMLFLSAVLIIYFGAYWVSLDRMTSALNTVEKSMGVQ